MVVATYFYYEVVGFFFFNWDSLHARLNSHYETWSYKKRSKKQITGYIKSVSKEPTVKKMSVNSGLKATKIIGQREAFYEVQVKIITMKCAVMQLIYF